MNPTLFLDRDGTINVDLGTYVCQPEEVELVPGSAEAIARAVKLGFKIAVITNQAGVAKGMTKAEALPKIHARLEELIAERTGMSGFRFDDVRVCMHGPRENCACRKPGTKLVEEASAKLSSDLGRSFFVGDKLADVQCGVRAGMRSILVQTGYGKGTQLAIESEPGAERPAAILADLKSAVDWIENQARKP